MITRRDVLRSLPLISLAPNVPGFLARSARAAAPQKDGRVLVVIQLDGGNDGINTVVPFKDEGYARNRQALALPVNRLISVTQGIGLHPAMQGAGRILEAGRLAIVPGVGYPNPDRSHFRSMAIWHTARFDPVDHTGPGWIGAASMPKPFPRRAVRRRSISAPAPFLQPCAADRRPPARSNTSTTSPSTNPTRPSLWPAT